MFPSTILERPTTDSGKGPRHVGRSFCTVAVTGPNSGRQPCFSFACRATAAWQRWLPPQKQGVYGTGRLSGREPISLPSVRGEFPARRTFYKPDES